MTDRLILRHLLVMLRLLAWRLPLATAEAFDKEMQAVETLIKGK